MPFGLSVTIPDKMVDMSAPGTASHVHRSTRQGAAIREALQSHEGFASAQELYANLRASGHGIGLSTVYRHLQQLAEQELVDVIHRPDGETVYRYCGDRSTGHHHHLVCRECGRTEEVRGRAIERWAEETAAKYGFVDVDHTVEVFGICENCVEG
jgi:Fur family ferric uptake transcriptional regulator